MPLSNRSLRDGVLWCTFPGNKLPGYDHLVPPGQKNPFFNRCRTMLMPALRASRPIYRHYSMTPRCISLFSEHGTTALAKQPLLGILLIPLCLDNPRSHLTMEMLSRSSASEFGRCRIHGQLKSSATRFPRAIV